MTDYKILVQELRDDGTTLNVAVSEIRGATDVDHAILRFAYGHLGPVGDEAPRRNG